MPLRETIDRIRSLPVPPNEESTKVQAVLPTLTALGWDQADPNRVQLEYNAGGKSKKRRIDIALIGEPHVVAFIEVKAPGQKLDDHLDQVLEYAFRVGVDICALTDGLVWWFFLPREKGPARDRCFATFNLNSDPVDHVAERLRAFLGREELLSHRAELRAKKALRALRELAELRARIPQVWREMRGQPDPELIQLVTRRVAAKTHLQPTPEQVAAVLRGDVVPDTTSPVPLTTESIKPRNPDAASSGDPPKPVARREVSPRKKKGSSRRPTGFLLWNQRYAATTHKSVLLDVAQLLFREHSPEFEKALKLRGRKRRWVSTDPDQLRVAGPIEGSPYFVEANLSAQSIERLCHKLLAVFGHRPGDLKILFD